MKKLILVIAALCSSHFAHATYLSNTANFYTHFQFGFIYEGKWVQSATARAYVLTRRHSGSTADSSIVSESRDSVLDVQLTKGSNGFTGKSILSGSGISGSGPLDEIVGAFVEYKLKFEDGTEITTPTYPIPVTDSVSMMYENDAVKAKIFELIKAFNRGSYKPETAAFEIENIDI